MGFQRLTPSKRFTGVLDGPVLVGVEFGVVGVAVAVGVGVLVDVAVGVDDWACKF